MQTYVTVALICELYEFEAHTYDHARSKVTTVSYAAKLCDYI